MVCTGNICRSPMAELLLAHRLRERLSPDDARRFTVGSAGTHGLTGWSIERDAARYLDSIGVALDPLDPFVARELDASLVEEADLVLGATRQHRAAAVTLVPIAGSRTFTLLEFARLIDRDDVATPTDDPVERLRLLVAAAARRRATTRSNPRGEDDIGDPYGSSYAAFERVGRQIADAVDTIVDHLAG